MDFKDEFEWELPFKAQLEEKSKESRGLDFNVIYNDVIRFPSTVMNKEILGKFQNELNYSLKYQISGKWFWQHFFFYNALVIQSLVGNWYFLRYEANS